MAKRRIKFTFPPDLVKQPLIYNIGQEFEVVTNIRRASVARDRGWVILEITGSDDEIDRAIAWSKRQGVRVDPIEGDVVAG
jgi:L-aspartate semialdehyde sulfurtransferase ferredoxin